MPKVKEQYFIDKVNQILDVAFQVCMKKPVYTVTMKDIVTESGLSQGGVYKYFSNIDEVLISLLNRGYEKYNINKDIEDILKLDTTPEIIINKVFNYIANHISQSITSYGKINYEIVTINQINPKRYEEIRKKLNIANSMDYIVENIFKFIIKNIENGYFKPIIPINELFQFIIVCYDGILRDITLVKCYPITSETPNFDINKLMNNLYLTVIYFLGINNLN